MGIKAKRWKQIHCSEIKTKFKEKLNNQTDKTWKNLKLIKETVKEKIGLIKPKTKNVKKYNDKIESLS